MGIFVAGGTGLVGRAVVRALLQGGRSVRVLTRGIARARAVLGDGPSFLEGDPTTPGTWQEGLDGAEAAIFLAGEPIFGGRWTARNKEKIRTSRVEGVRRLVEAIARAGVRPRVLISASAVGYYGPRGDEEIDESAPPGDDFLAQVCTEWEAAAHEAEGLGVRVVLLRLGIVLAAEGGALDHMRPAFRFFLGGPLGSGEQWVSWIHIEDVAGLCLHALRTDRLRGPVNATAPDPVRSRGFARALGRAMGRPAVVRMPGWALRLLMGGAAQVVLSGVRVVPRAALDSGYRFRFPELRGALRDLLGGGAS